MDKPYTEVAVTLRKQVFLHSFVHYEMMMMIMMVIIMVMIINMIIIVIIIAMTLMMIMMNIMMILWWFEGDGDGDDDEEENGDGDNGVMKKSVGICALGMCWDCVWFVFKSRFCNMMRIIFRLWYFSHHHNGTASWCLGWSHEPKICAIYFTICLWPKTYPEWKTTNFARYFTNSYDYGIWFWNIVTTLICA